MIDWISNHSTDLSSNNICDLQTLKENLDFENLHIENRKNGESIIIIPLSYEVNKKLNLDQNYISNLVIIQSTKGKMRFSTIISFLSARKKNKSPLRIKLSKI